MLSITETQELVISREFDAPRELVFKAWTEIDRLAQWWGPKGMQLGIEQLDLRPGGIFHYYILLPGDMKMWGRFSYRGITAPKHIEYVSSFSDESGSITRAPFSPTWPLEILNTLTLTEQNGKTTLTQSSTPIHATTEERKTFEDNLESLKQGLSGTFDQLEAYLAKHLS